MATQTMPRDYVLKDFPHVQTLFNHKLLSWLWLAVRLYLGIRWLESGFEKITNPAWTQTGMALKGFWERAVLIPEAPARPAIAFNWYRTFLEFMLDSGAYTWFAKLIPVGEMLVGIALILGIFVWFAAAMGGFMNFNFMLAGSASVNPVFFALSVLLILAWKTAGWIGLDRWALYYIGTPWQPGTLFQKK
jgi:thiosulfate dehydrogenase [quinone] large subunit